MSVEPVSVSVVPRPPSPSNEGRVDLIAHLAWFVERHEASGVSHRVAIRRTAAEAGLHPMIVKRLVDLYPEA